MKRRILFGSLFILLLTIPLFSQQGQQYNTPISASDTNTAVNFGFNATQLVLRNDGPNSVFLNFTSTTATTSSFELKNGEALSLSVERSSAGWGFLGAICSAGETATVRILAVKNF
jgi:hypothetical protein